MIEASLYTLLSAIVPTSPLTAPDNTPVPYCIYQRVSTVPGNYLDDSPVLEHVHFQIDIHHSSLNAARVLANSVKAALRAASFGGYVTGDQDIYETEVKLYRVVIDFEVFA